MKQRNKKYQTVSLRRIFPAVGMMLLLLLLTTMNYFIYPSSDTKAISCWASAGGDEESPENGNNSNPAGPDEKSPNKPISVNEEYIHEGPEADNPIWVNMLFEHAIHETEKLQIVHFELITPPPKA